MTNRKSKRKKKLSYEEIFKILDRPDSPYRQMADFHAARMGTGGLGCKLIDEGYDSKRLRKISRRSVTKNVRSAGNAARRMGSILSAEDEAGRERMRVVARNSLPLFVQAAGEAAGLIGQEYLSLKKKKRKAR